MLSFQDNFWGEENRGFGVLLKRLKYGRHCTEGLLAFIAARIEVEEDYVRKLQRLGNFTFPREELYFGGKVKDYDLTSILPSDLAGALWSLPIQTTEACSRHATLVESLKQRLLWPLEHSLKEQTVVKKQHKQEMLRIVKNKNSQQESVNKLKERYFTRSKEKTLLIDANMSGLSGKALDKYEQKLKKAKEAEQEADAEYRSGIYKLNELHTQWQSRMNISAQEFQKLDETRLELTKHVVLEYSVISQCHMQEVALAYEKIRDRALQCDRFIEIQEFIKRHKTGVLIPTSPAYTNFPYETVEDSLRRLSIRAKQSPRRLYSSESSEELSAAGVMGGLVGPKSPLCSEYSSTSSGKSLTSGFTTTTTRIDSNNNQGVEESRRGSVTSFSSNSSFSGKSTTKSIHCLFQVRTQFAYQAQQSDELSFKANQTIDVICTLEDPWWYGEINGTKEKGLFPSNYVEKLGQ